MVRLIDFERHPNGPRLRLLGQRSHHGAWGCLLLLVRNRYVRIAGAVAIIHDRRDAPQWFRGGYQA